MIHTLDWTDVALQSSEERTGLSVTVMSQCDVHVKKKKVILHTIYTRTQNNAHVDFKSICDK